MNNHHDHHHDHQQLEKGVNGTVACSSYHHAIPLHDDGFHFFSRVWSMLLINLSRSSSGSSRREEEVFPSCSYGSWATRGSLGKREGRLSGKRPTPLPDRATCHACTRHRDEALWEYSSGSTGVMEVERDYSRNGTRKEGTFLSLWQPLGMAEGWRDRNPWECCL